MEGLQPYNVFFMALKLMMPVLVAAIIAAVVAALFTFITRIDDAVVGFFAKLCLVLFTLYLLQGYFVSSLVSFTQLVWGGANYYY